MCRHLTIFLCGLLIAGLAEARWFASAEFAAPDSRPQKLALLPPHAEMMKAKMVLTEELVQEAQRLEAVTTDAMTARLRGLGYQVIVVDQNAINADPTLQELVLKANTRYDEEWARILRKPKRVRYGYYSAGDEARILAAALDVDGIVFTRILATGAGAGRQVARALIGGLFAAATYTRLDASIVDGDDGKVEAFYYAQFETAFSQITTHAEKTMFRLTKKTFKKYPAVDKSLKVRAPTEAEIASIEEEDEDALLDELEALLGAETEAPSSKDTASQ